jgi:D-glycero-alpha-D-manno-heptose-7-phosphate kinase
VPTSNTSGIEGIEMIITQTPLRIGLVGGGTDIPSYYREHGGRVLNCAIDKYVYVIVKQRFDDEIYVNYSKKEIVSSVDDLEHELVREAMLMTGVREGVEITMLADIPSSGSRLGSSSSITVGLLNALFAYRGWQLHGAELAELACTIEIERCGKPIGKQDQYIAALGGMRDIRFGPGEKVEAEKMVLAPSERRSLQRQVMLFYTGTTRNANTILSEQTANVSSTLNHLHQLRDLAAAAVEQLRCGDIDSLGPALRAGWGDQASRGFWRVKRVRRLGGRSGPGSRGIGRQDHRRGRRWVLAGDLPGRETASRAREPLQDAGAADQVRHPRDSGGAERRSRHLDLIPAAAEPRLWPVLDRGRKRYSAARKGRSPGLRCRRIGHPPVGRPGQPPGGGCATGARPWLVTMSRVSAQARATPVPTAAPATASVKVCAPLAIIVRATAVATTSAMNTSSNRTAPGTRRRGGSASSTAQTAASANMPVACPLGKPASSCPPM